MAMGAERDPGETHANSTPWAASSSTKVAANDCVTSAIGSSRDSGAWGREAELLFGRRRRACHPPPRFHPERAHLARADLAHAGRLPLDRSRPPGPRRDADPARGAVLDGGV